MLAACLLHKCYIYETTYSVSSVADTKANAVMLASNAKTLRYRRMYTKSTIATERKLAK